MSKEDHSDHSEEASGKSVHWSIKLALGLILFYMVSFGPLLYGFVKMSVFVRSSIFERMMLAYGMPHFHVAHQSEGYFEYLSWYVQKVTGSNLAPSHKIFQDAFEGTVFGGWPDELR